MRWNDITVWQYQNIVKALSDKGLDDIDKSFKLIALVYNMTDNQVDSLLQEDYITKMPFGRYVETKAFVGDIYANLHKLGATMVMPQKRTWYGRWVDDKYDAGMHEDYAEDILAANFTDVYFSLVFFYQVYRNWIEVTKDYLVTKMMMTGQTMEQSSQVVTNLCSILDGIIQPNLLPTTKILELRKFTTDPQ